MDKTETLFHDTYTGPRYTYGLSYRPLGIGAVPTGWIVGSLRDDPAGRFRHGLVDYPMALTPRERGSYELAQVLTLKASGPDLPPLTYRLEDNNTQVRLTVQGDKWVVLFNKSLRDAAHDLQMALALVGYSVSISGYGDWPTDPYGGLR